jgi:ribosome-associated protein
MLVDTIVDKKGSDILLLDIREYASFADYFLIGNGENERQLKTLAEEIALKSKTHAGANDVGIEGIASAGWVLIDLGDLVVHLFSPQKRDYYGLEDIWDDAHVILRMQ